MSTLFPLPRIKTFGRSVAALSIGRCLSLHGHTPRTLRRLCGSSVITAGFSSRASYPASLRVNEAIGGVNSETSGYHEESPRPRSVRPMRFWPVVLHVLCLRLATH